MQRLLSLLGFAGTLGGCGTTERNFELHYVAAVCERIEVCATWETLDSSRDQCVEQQIRDLRQLDGFDPRQAKKCIQALYDADCEEGIVPTACGTVYEN